MRRSSAPRSARSLQREGRPHLGLQRPHRARRDRQVVAQRDRQRGGGAPGTTSPTGTRSSRTGKFMYLSFRNLDAIYKVNRKTGEIVWKLGGTETPESLEVLERSRRRLSARRPARRPGSAERNDHRLQQPDRPRRRRPARTALPGRRGGRHRHARRDGHRQARQFSLLLRLRPAAPVQGVAHFLGQQRLGRRLRSEGPGHLPAHDAGFFTYRANPVPDGALTGRELRRAMDKLNP